MTSSSTSVNGGKGKEVLTPEEEKKNTKWSIVCAILLIGVPLLWYLLHCLISNY